MHGGRCPTCGNDFVSRSRKKTYCSMPCYLASGRFADMARQRAAERARSVPDQLCRECGATLPPNKPGGKKSYKKFCGKACRRAWMSQRFDRWIASPGTIRMGQAYDEFLMLDKLPCLVAGCHWEGDHLSYHMNVVHGVDAASFKRLAGFNKRTGIISRPTHLKLVELARASGRILRPPTGRAWARGRRGPRASEGREHAAQARASTARSYECTVCGSEYLAGQHSAFCSRKCLTAERRERDRLRSWAATCGLCGSSFACTDRQDRRRRKGGLIFCSARCKQSHNGSRPKVSRGVSRCFAEIHGSSRHEAHENPPESSRNG